MRRYSATNFIEHLVVQFKFGLFLAEIAVAEEFSDLGLVLCNKVAVVMVLVVCVARLWQPVVTWVEQNVAFLGRDVFAVDPLDDHNLKGE